LLERGVMVSRTADDLVRYHGKMLLVDERLFVLGFNFTKLDIEKSRSFGLVTDTPSLVAAAEDLFQADSTRRMYTAGRDQDFVVSPQLSRVTLTQFIRSARKQLLIYDAKLSDPGMLRLLRAKQGEGVEVRVIGKVGKGAPLDAVRLEGIRLHVRAIVVDGREVFIGSQSLRKLELDGRREIGLICREPAIARRVAQVFEKDRRGLS